MSLIFTLLACSSSSMNLSVGQLMPVATKEARLQIDGTSGQLEHLQTLHLMFSGESENPTPGQVSLPVSLSNVRIELGTKDENPLPLPASTHAVDLRLAPNEGIIKEATVQFPVKLKVVEPQLAPLRSFCEVGKSDFHFRADWTTPLIEDPGLGWTLQPGSGSLYLLLEPQQVRVVCAPNPP